MNPFRHRALVGALLFSLALPAPADAAWFFSRKASTEAAAPVAPVAELLPPMVEDGHDLSCIQEIVAARDMKAWKEAKKKYYEKNSRPFPSRAWGKVAWGLLGGIAVLLVARLSSEPEKLLGAAILAPLGIYVADWLSALYHKFLDSFADEKSRWWGTMARDFRVHHEDPNQIHNATYWDRVADPAKPMSPLLLATLVGLHQHVISPEIATGVWTFFLFGIHGAIFHQYAHTNKPPRVAALLQSLKLALGREAHMRHHKAPFEQTFGVVNGWSESLAQWLDLWRRLDRFYWKHWHRMPGNWIQDPRSIPPEVMAELKADFESIPDPLWGYSLTAYPLRVPAELRADLERVRARWRTEFVRLRQKEYREVAEHDRPLAERLWKQELEEFAWIYGPTFFAFDEDLADEGAGDEAPPEG